MKFTTDNGKSFNLFAEKRGIISSRFVIYNKKGFGGNEKVYSSSEATSKTEALAEARAYLEKKHS